MPLEIWLAFVLASTVLLIIPGPTVMLVVSYALGRGRATGLWTVPGVALGDLTAMTVSLAGAGALLATSATLFTVLKLIGAAYLIYLGVGLWRAPIEAPEAAAPTTARTGRSMFATAYVVTTLNPKGIIFFIAFVPQFIDPSAAALPQFVILIATFVTLAAINVAIWAWLAGTARNRMTRPSVLKWLNRSGGSVLVGAGVLTAMAQRP